MYEALCKTCTTYTLPALPSRNRNKHLGTINTLGVRVPERAKHGRKYSGVFLWENTSVYTPKLELCPINYARLTLLQTCCLEDYRCDGIYYYCAVCYTHVYVHYSIQYMYIQYSDRGITERLKAECRSESALHSQITSRHKRPFATNAVMLNLKLKPCNAELKWNFFWD